MKAEVKRYWDKLRSHGLTNKELVDIIRNVKALQTSAWQQLKKQDPTADEMIALLDSPAVLTQRLASQISRQILTLSLNRGQAWKLYDKCVLSEYGWIARIILELRPTVDQLSSIVCSSSSLKGRAARMLLTRGVCRAEHLARIMSNVKSLREKAWKRLLDMGIGSELFDFDALVHIFCHVPEYKEIAWEYMQKVDLKSGHIRMVNGNKELRVRIGKYVLKNEGKCLALAKKPEAFKGALELAKSSRRDSIREVYDLVSELQEQAIRTLLDFGPSIGYLRFIVLRTQYFREEAAQRLLEHKECNVEDALQIMEGFASLRQTAWQTLLEKKPSIQQLKQAGEIRGYAGKAKEAIDDASKEAILEELTRISNPH